MEIKGEHHWNSGMPLLSEGQRMLVYVWNSFDKDTQFRKALSEVKGTRLPSKKHPLKIL